MNLSDEERQRRSDRMKALAKTRNDLLKKQKAERIQTPPPEPVQPPTPTPPPQPTPEPVKVRAPRQPKKKEEPIKERQLKKSKKVVLVESSDSEEYGDSGTGSESEDEVIYVTKKSDKMTKPKAKKEKALPIPEPPMVKVKFF